MSKGIACGLEQSAIDKLKEKHGALFFVTIKDGDKKYEAIYKEPDATIMSAVNAASKLDEIKGTLVLYNACIVEADADIKNRDLLKIQVAASISERMTLLTREVKNL
jgi:hypothetical protein